MDETRREGKQRRHLGEQAWREVFERFDGSGLGVQAFCRREGLCRSSFTRWRARLRAEGRRVEMPARQARRAHGNAFVDLGMLGAGVSAPAAATAAAVAAGALELRIELGGGIVLTLARR